MRFALRVFWLDVRGRWLEWRERRRDVRENRLLDLPTEIRARWRIR